MSTAPNANQHSMAAAAILTPADGGVDADVLERQFHDAKIQFNQAAKPDDIPLHRLNGSQNIVYLDANGVWRIASMRDLLLLLPEAGVQMPEKREDAKALCAHYQALILRSKTVDNCLPIAGCKAGLLETPTGGRILVSRDSGFVEPVPGNSEPIKLFLQALFREQWGIVVSWMKLALDDLQRCREVGPYAANLRPHQALIIIGPPGCGKTLLKHIIVAAFGGTSADPAQFLSASTNFNSDLGEAVTLVMDDNSSSYDPQTRNRITQSLKQIQVTGEVRVEAKFQVPRMAKMCQRILILANEDSVQSLPMMQESYRDKAHILEAHSSGLVGDWNSEAAKNEWVASLMASIPAFVHYALKEHVIPPEQFNARYGMDAYHNARILSMMEGDDSLGLIHQLVQYTIAVPKPPSDFPGKPNKETYFWEGLASELFALSQKRGHPQVAAKTLRNAHHLGTALSTLKHQMPAVYAKGKFIHGNQKWTITFSLQSDDWVHLVNLFGKNDSSQLADDEEMRPVRKKLLGD